MARIHTCLREERIKAGLSQEAISRKMNVSRQTIVNIEKGHTIPNVILAMAISKTVGVPVEKLFWKANHK